MSKQSTDISPIEKGALTIKKYAKILEEKPGVYRMLDKDGNILYIGKAKNLQKRVTNYTNPNRLTNRLQRMVSMTHKMEFITTDSEIEALLLESNLIKKYLPKFNILLRDDKSFSYIKITRHHPFPQITKHRGAKTSKDDYFGPFPSANAVNKTIIALQKAFLIRNCEDSIFKNRTRPCLQYQIKRCTAPCVQKISQANYQKQVSDVCEFLKGKSHKVKKGLITQMNKASDGLDYELAARIRDRIKALTAIQAHQNINIEGLGDADVIALYREGARSCIQIFFFRGGSHFGNRAYFPKHTEDATDDDITAAFLGQFYTNHFPPSQIIASVSIKDKALVEDALSQEAGKSVKLITPSRGNKKELIQNAYDNAKQALHRKQNETISHQKLLNELKERFNLPKLPNRIEVYDNSHIQGTHPIGAMIVTNEEGFHKAAYRKFNIRSQEVTSDDYAMMAEVLKRRFSGTLSTGAKNENVFPDLIIVDGGKGQLSIALKTLTDLDITDIPLLSIAKGPNRNAGNETFYMPGKDAIRLEPESPLLYFIERLRDESHRFAIGTHRSRREKQITKSPLDGISGIGAMRKKALLVHFGSAKAIETASLQEICKIEGISQSLAKKIYDYFH